MENPKVGRRKKTLKLGIRPKDSADRLASSSNHNAAGIAAQTESRGVAEGGGGKRRRIGGPETSSWVQTPRTSPDYKTLLNSLRSTPKPPYIEDFQRCRTHADYVKFFADRSASSSNHNAAGMAAQTESSGVAEGGGGKRRRIGGPETPRTSPDYKTLLNSLRSTPKPPYIEDFQRCRTHADYVKSDRLASSSNHNAAGMAAQTESSGVAEGGGGKRRRIGGPETSPSVGTGSAEGSQGSEWNQSEIDGLFCSICLDAWTNDGDHHISCLPCGHVYGMSCITKWLRHTSSGKCPQCKKKCKLEDIRKLFVSRVVSVDEEAQNRIRVLEDKCASLEEKVADYAKKEAERLQKETEFGACLGAFLYQPFTNFKI